MADEDPDIVAGRAIAGAAGKPANGKPKTTGADASTDPDIAAGRTIAAQTPPATTAATTQATSGPPPDTIAPGLRNWIAPAPNTTYGSVFPLARDETTGATRWALPSSIRSMATGALDLAEGPITGTVTPEGTNLLLQGAMAGLGDPSPAYGTGKAISPFTGWRAPPRPEPPLSGVKPPDPGMTASAAAGAGPTSGVPPVAEGMPRTVQSSADAKTIAGAYYDIAASKGTASALTPEATGKMIDAASAVGGKGEFGKAVAGKDNAITDIRAELEKLRGKSATLADVQEMDEAMTARIQQEYKTGSDKVAGQLHDIQTAWRNIYGNAGEGDVVGGADGFAALKPARLAWSTAMKMQDVEQMQSRVEGLQNPTTSFKTRVNNFVNSAKARGWSDDEIAALKAAADRGAVGEVMHHLGSRLVPHVAGTVGTNVGAAIGGVTGALTGFGVGEAGGYVLGGTARAAANALQQRRISNAYSILGRGAPPPPPGSTYAPAPPSSGIVNPLLSGTAPLAPAVVPPAYQQGRTMLPNALWPGA